MNHTFAGNVTISGWAIDTASTSGTGIVGVSIWIDGPAGQTGSTDLAEITTFGPRSDVAANYGPQFLNSGFNVTVDLGGYPNGPHTLYVYEHTSGGGLTFSTRIFSLDNAVGFLDAPTGQTVANNVTVDGWACDPGASNGTGIDMVDIYADGLEGQGAFVTRITNFSNRQDVVNAGYGQHCLTSGFNAAIDVGGWVNGTHTLYMYAHSIQYGWNWHFNTEQFTVAHIPAPSCTTASPRDDLNVDGTVNLTDFSIFARDWHKNTSTGPALASPYSDMNCDGVVDLIDFSIFARNWPPSSSQAARGGPGTTVAARQTLSSSTSPSATMSVLPSSGTFNAGDTVTVSLTVDGGGQAFNAAQATVDLAGPVSVQSVNMGDCNATFVQSPTTSDPSFAGATLGNASTGCTVYTLTLHVTGSGPVSINLTNANLLAAADSANILSNVVDGAYNGAPTVTPQPPTDTPVPPTATNTPIPPTAIPVAPSSTSVPPTNTPMTPTPIPPTATPIPPTSTPVPPTQTPMPVPPTNTATSTALAPSGATATPAGASNSPTATVAPVTATPQRGGLSGTPSPAPLLALLREQGSVVAGHALPLALRTAAHVRVSVMFQITATRMVMVGRGKQRHRVRRTVVLYHLTRQGTSDAHGRFTATLPISYHTESMAWGLLTVTVRTPHDVATRTARVSVAPWEGYPLALGFLPHTVVSGMALPLHVQTLPHARLTAMLRVTATRVVMIGAGAHRKRIRRTVVLYQVAGHGVADAHGRAAFMLAVRYRPVRPATARLTVVEQASGGATTRTKTVTIRP